MLRNEFALLSSVPVGNRTRIENGGVILKLGFVEMDCRKEVWLQTDLCLKQIGSSVEVQ